MTPAASIVVPLLRQRGEWLRQAVRSAAVQTAPCEVIVVTSLATPASNLGVLQALAAEFANVRVVPGMGSPPNGFPRDLNTGIRAASAARVGFLLSDDWLEPDCVEACLAVEADIVSTQLRVFLEDGQTRLPEADALLSAERYESLRGLEPRAAYLSHFFLFRKDAVERAGYVDETIGNFPGIDDYHLPWTLLEQGATVAIVERQLYNYRDHDGERLTLADPEEAVRNLGRILDKHGVTDPERARLIKEKRQWFGKAIYRVLERRWFGKSLSLVLGRRKG